MFLKIIGAAIVLWGIADLIIGLQGGDLWAQVGITLPDIVWQYSHYAAFVIGGIIFSMGGGNEDETDG